MRLLEKLLQRCLKFSIAKNVNEGVDNGVEELGVNSEMIERGAKRNGDIEINQHKKGLIERQTESETYGNGNQGFQ